jgi:hypothetical protein
MTEMTEEQKLEIKNAILCQSHIVYQINMCGYSEEDDSQVGLYVDEIDNLVNEIAEIIEE